MKTVFTLLFALFLGLFCNAQIKYVTQNGAGLKDGSSWTNAWGSEEFGNNIFNVSQGTTCWLAKGIYLPTRTASGTIPTQVGEAVYFIPKGVKLYGGFSGTETTLSERNYSTIHTLNKTVLSGDSGAVNFQGDNLRRVLLMTNCGSGEIVDGLTIGYSLNAAIEVRFSTAIIQNPVFNNCILRDNYPFGGPYTALNAYGSLTGNAVTISNCYVYNNGTSQTGFGAIASFGCKLDIFNSTFCNNFSQQAVPGNNYGIAIHVNNTGATITNCTFFKNPTFNDGICPVISTENASDSVRINNCIFWKNQTASGVYTLNVVGGQNYFSVKNSVFPVQNAGTAPAVLINPILLDPVFVNENNPAGADNEFNTSDDGLRLSLCTNIANLGDNSLVVSATDYLGNPRIFGTNTDPGSHELQSNPVVFQITNQPVNATVCEGINTSFLAIASGPGNIYQWQEKNGTLWNNLVDGLQYSGVNSTTLNVLSPASSMNGKIYRCVITNGSCPDLTTNEVTLTINSPVLVTADPFDRLFCENGSVSYSISAAGSGLVYQWQQSNGNGWVNLANSSNYSGVSTSELTLNNIGISFNGLQYRCYVVGGCGADTSNNASLTLSTVSGRLYVNAAQTLSGNGISWATAFKTIDEALLNTGCLTGENEIWVARGVYYPARDTFNNYTPANARTKSFKIPNGIKIFGGFAGNETILGNRSISDLFTTNQTILSGDLDFTPNDSLQNAYHIMVLRNVDTFTKVDGFVFEKANANGTSLNAAGGAIYCKQDFDKKNEPIISNCLFRNNYANKGACIFSDPSYSYSILRITQCRFINNRSVIGAAIDVEGGSSNFPYGRTLVDNCEFENNFTTSSGAAINMTFNSSAQSGWGLDVLNSTFINNTSSIDNGGAISVKGVGGQSTDPGEVVISNCVFDSNFAENGGAIYQQKVTSKILNNPFFNNRATIKGGSIALGAFTTCDISNSIFWGNKIGVQTSNVEFTNVPIPVTVSNSNFPLQTLTPIPSLINCIDVYPSFTDTSNRKGPDNIYGTTDDGLNLNLSSPCVDAGLNEFNTVLTNVDVTGNSRVKGCRIDMGAYENQTASYIANSLYNGNAQTCTQYPISATGTLFVDTVSCAAIVNVIPNSTSPLNGLVKACVSNDATVQFVNGIPYVQRHYDIIPTNDTANATARVTIFFTQLDFNNYNIAAIGFPQLPTGPGDNAGKANILIEQHHGISVTGVPGTYSGSVEFIDPDDNDIVWNASNGLWEITFDVNGFSGFFLRTLNTVPLTLLNFTGKESDKGIQLNWQTENEINTSHFEILRSSDGRHFTNIGSKNAMGNGIGSYQFIDYDPFDAGNYYKLHMKDNDGKSSFSYVIFINRKSRFFDFVEIFPNPVNAEAVINIRSNFSGLANISVIDIGGRRVKSFKTLITSGIQKIPFSAKGLYNGLYVLEVLLENQQLRTKFLIQ